MAHSVDLRERVINAIKEGMRIGEAAKTFKVCRRIIYDWQDLLEDTGSLKPKSGYQKGHSHKIKDWDQFRDFVEKHKGSVSPEMRIEWEKLTGVHLSESVMLRALKKIGYSFKKKHLITPKQIKKNVISS